eukprot:CAMPEP_0203751124 /NCGR_PEP_ID=MMETSP0098-20131031/5248_1 /ASSEMBLY_ACC=CAM_ASM_000208 /TAXON_ID=96639 /ORGANISM=" , Strain NY0313808BC1" /LENGTH=37 /DNA_ID= /DNA_START= /DNA_END= /DNA_ORIENTATION=
MTYQGSCTQTTTLAGYLVEVFSHVNLLDVVLSERASS